MSIYPEPSRAGLVSCRDHGYQREWLEEAIHTFRSAWREREEQLGGIDLIKGMYQALCRIEWQEPSTVGDHHEQQVKKRFAWLEHG